MVCTHQRQSFKKSVQGRHHTLRNSPRHRGRQRDPLDVKLKSIEQATEFLPIYSSDIRVRSVRDRKVVEKNVTRATQNTLARNRDLAALALTQNRAQYRVEHNDVERARRPGKLLAQANAEVYSATQAFPCEGERIRPSIDAGEPRGRTTPCQEFSEKVALPAPEVENIDRAQILKASRTEKTLRLKISVR